MPVAATLTRPTPPDAIRNKDCRVWVRHECDLPTSCQPVAARGPDEPQWQGRIRDISAGGVGIIVVRRFERGTGLAIELPAVGDYPGDTLLARVVHVRQLLAGGWLLGCSFVSPLSESTVDRVIGQQPEYPSRIAATPFPNGSMEGMSLGNAEPIVVSHVRWHNRESGVTRPARRLVLHGECWPFPTHMVLRLWVERKTGDHDFTRVRINACEQQGDGWLINYSILGTPSPRMSTWLDRG